MKRRWWRFVCRMRGHVPRLGINGWENFGTGWFCARCGAEVGPYTVTLHAAEVSQEATPEGGE